MWESMCRRSRAVPLLLPLPSRSISTPPPWCCPPPISSPACMHARTLHELVGSRNAKQLSVCRRCIVAGGSTSEGHPRFRLTTSCRYSCFFFLGRLLKNVAAKRDFQAQNTPKCICGGGFAPDHWRSLHG